VVNKRHQHQIIELPALRVDCLPPVNINTEDYEDIFPSEFSEDAVIHWSELSIVIVGNAYH
jgi:hypothetical protein